ncbi:MULTISPECIES: GPW/gp25 family protein [unclassified Moorena]|uniref:GPW/gp25 family protein n=1 Tax=Moorena TaxID=1155738 RepID=UPI0013C1243D|nr:MULTISPECIES: GPW/gp25 family protein [unclassified Moorena]NEO08392.1 GPW/gp25 family protein [Moorena sp. SIO3I8]NEO48630.1 GPW/gp25 family protein [Moorena sp. SIO4A3]NEP23518.1 GPW/gp25 family protein [Moorena sp. SIO3I6]
MTKPFLGVGVGFPLSLDTQGDFQLAEYEESVRQSILIILGTARGERIMRPDFGCGIYDLVFEPNSAATTARVSEAVQEALLRFEPRIDVVDVRVQSPTPEQMLVNIDYRVRATNNVFNLVYPFYLEGGAG